ncbi:TadE-like protein [Thermanaeromonas toyohensis ToBE]|uniref:TadE-like protein n=1 Tax=Thermanaeromonas toyohensis ToBE TaxID=698762 RepID=A0A1W1VNF2_9FIRM|nr:TadE/TadG family type IV pilus assembly protein [Thermanaeromonas toyohensis]SMB94892.1 TadE-like protein [Thermanaeromonas toyohensis ToBE]
MRLRDCQGQALVEMALILPLLVLLIMGTWDLGHILGDYLLLLSASREGARVGAVGASDEAIRARIKEAAPTLEITDDKILITPEEALRRPGVALQVRIEYEARLFTPLLSQLIPNPFPLKVETVMRVE